MDILEIIHRTDHRFELMLVQKLKNIPHYVVRGVIAVKSREIHSVRDILYRIKMISLIDLAENARVADDTALRHAHHRVLDRLDTDKLKRLRHARHLTAKAAVIENSLVAPRTFKQRKF